MIFRGSVYASAFCFIVTSLLGSFCASSLAFAEEKIEIASIETPFTVPLPEALPFPAASQASDISAAKKLNRATTSLASSKAVSEEKRETQAESRPKGFWPSLTYRLRSKSNANSEAVSASETSHWFDFFNTPSEANETSAKHVEKTPVADSADAVHGTALSIQAERQQLASVSASPLIPKARADLRFQTDKAGLLPLGRAGLPGNSLLTGLSSSWSITPQNRLECRDSLIRFIGSYNRQLSWQYKVGLANAILDYSQDNHIDYRLTASILAVESGFRFDAISSTGAIGLGQLKDFTARWLHVANPFDPVDNIAGTTRYLSYLVSLFPNELHKAVGSYYIGQGAMQRSGFNAPAESYVKKVEIAYTSLVNS